MEELQVESRSTKSDALRIAIDQAIETKRSIPLDLPRQDLLDLRSLVEKGFIDSLEFAVKHAVKQYIVWARKELTDREKERSTVR